jgi:hypothetical protein
MEDSVDFDCSSALGYTDLRNVFNKLEANQLIEDPNVHNTLFNALSIHESKIKI